jgi:hypothetical protein
MHAPVTLDHRYRGSIPVSVSTPFQGVPRRVWEARDDLEPSVPTHNGVLAPGFDSVPSLNTHSGDPRSPVPRFHPGFCVDSVPGGPETRLGGEGRPGTISTDPQRFIGTGIRQCSLTRYSHRWPTGPRSPVPRFHPGFCVASAPGGPETRLGGEGRPGTISTGPHRRIGTGIWPT